MFRRFGVASFDRIWPNLIEFDRIWPNIHQIYLLFKSVQTNIFLRKTNSWINKILCFWFFYISDNVNNGVYKIICVVAISQRGYCCCYRPCSSNYCFLFNIISNVFQFGSFHILQDKYICYYSTNYLKAFLLIQVMFSLYKINRTIITIKRFLMSTVSPLSFPHLFSQLTLEITSYNLSIDRAWRKVQSGKL